MEQDAITETEAEIFNTVHNAAEQYHIEHPEVVNSGVNANERETETLTALVDEKIITQQQANAFTDIHDHLGASGLMP